jgi:hypothetical protein
MGDWNICLFVLCSLLLAGSASGGGQTSGTVCSSPVAQCNSSYSFKSYQLPFEIKEKLVFGKTYKSAPFYAVVLKSVRTNNTAECAFITEQQRLEAQTLLAGRKVFASRFSCSEELIVYTNVNQDFNFLAVYAGATMAEAKQILKKVNASRAYPQAYIRRMQVVLEYST